MNVEELAQMIKSRVNSIKEVTIKGEIGKITKASSGHVYFDIMGKNSRISCVCWSSSNISPVVGGAQIQISHVDYYAPFGKCQAIVNNVVSLADNSDIADKHAHTIKKLTDEGLIHRDRLTLPDIIFHLCIITSDESAAYHDMMEGIQSRFPNLKTTLIHSSVQGQNAVTSIQDAFKRAHLLKPDVIICGRGGGSESDLEVFNEEKVVRCFISRTIPIISAVGHESDHCICDLVSDFRAKTPTASIELCIPVSYADRQHKIFQLVEENHVQLQKKWNDLYNTFDLLRNTVCTITDKMLSSQKKYIESRGKTITVVLQNKLENYDKTLQSVKHRLYNMMREKLTTFEYHSKMMRSKLLTHSISHNLNNGYSILLNNENKVVRDIDRIQEADRLCVMLADGKIDVTVNNVVRKRKR